MDDEREMTELEQAEAELEECHNDLIDVVKQIDAAQAELTQYIGWKLSAQLEAARAETAEAALAAQGVRIGSLQEQVQELREADYSNRRRAETAEAALATERIALREFAKGALLRTMHDLSEACWCAGWLHGMEYFLWNVVENGKATEWGMDNVYQRDVDDLRRLRDLADGWWIWGDENVETFVSLDEMRRLVAVAP